MRTKLWWFMAILLIAFNLFLVVKKFSDGNQEQFQHNLEINTKEIVVESLKKLYDIDLVYTSNLPVDIDQALGIDKFKLLIFFSPNDCPVCLQEIYLWNRIAKELSVEVFGLVPHYNAGEVNSFVLNEGIEFEVWIDLKQKLFEYIDFSETPIKLLFDENNNMVSITKSFLNQKYEMEYFNYIKEQVD